VVVCVGAHAAGPEVAIGGALAGRFPVIALSAGGADASAGLRSALDAGAGRAVRLEDESLGQSDFHTLGRALAAAIAKFGGTLVLTGARSSDEGLGAVPAVIAERLGATLLAGAEDIEVLDDGRVAATVRIGGRLRRYAVSGTAVIQVARGPIGRPPAPVTGVEIEVMGLAAIGLDPGQIRRRDDLLGALEPANRQAVQVQSASELVAALGI